MRYKPAGLISTIANNTNKSVFTSTSQLLYFALLFDHRGWVLLFFLPPCLSFLLSSSPGDFFFLSRAGVGRRTLAASEFSRAAYPCQEMSSPNRCFPQRRCDKVSARGLKEKEKRARWREGLRRGRDVFTDTKDKSTWNLTLHGTKWTKDALDETFCFV